MSLDQFGVLASSYKGRLIFVTKKVMGSALLHTSYARYKAARAGAFFSKPHLIALRERMEQRGKEHKEIMVACARKLLIFANAVVARGTPWEETRPASA